MLTRITRTPATALAALLIDAERHGTPQARALDALAFAIGTGTKDLSAIVSHERSICAADIDEIAALAEVTRQSIGAFSYGFSIHKSETIVERMGEMDEEDADTPMSTRYRFIMSTADSDRARDIVDQSWKLDEFRNNPVAPWGHQSHELPVGMWHNVGVVNGALVGDLEPVPVAAYPRSVAVAEMLARNVIRTCSVGFLPGQVLARASFEEDDPRYGARGMWFANNVLMECSPCTVPMNAGAVSLGVVEDKPEQRSAETGRTSPPIPGLLDWMGLEVRTEDPKPSPILDWLV